MTRNPERLRHLMSILMGGAMLIAWAIILLHDPVGKGRRIGITGLVITVVGTGVMLRAYVNRQAYQTTLVVLSLASLVLVIAAMIILTF